MNNPISYSDPSGEFWQYLVLGVFTYLKGVYDNNGQTNPSNWNTGMVTFGVNASSSSAHLAAGISNNGYINGVYQFGYNYDAGEKSLNENIRRVRAEYRSQIDMRNTAYYTGKTLGLSDYEMKLLDMTPKELAIHCRELNEELMKTQKRLIDINNQLIIEQQYKDKMFRSSMGRLAIDLMFFYYPTNYLAYII